MKIIEVKEEDLSILSFTLELIEESKKRGNIDEEYADMLAMLNQLEFKDEPPKESLHKLISLALTFICVNDKIYEQFKDFLWEHK